MTKNAGMEEFYDKMGGECGSSGLDHVADEKAMEPDEAAPILADFAGKLDMEMSGKFWAPSESSLPVR